MITTHRYELWNGQKVIGHYNHGPICGKALALPFLSELKQPYGRKIETIIVPLMYRIVFSGKTSDGYIEYHKRLCLDVRRKSKRQIKRLLE